MPQSGIGCHREGGRRRFGEHGQDGLDLIETVRVGLFRLRSSRINRSIPRRILSLEVVLLFGQLEDCADDALDVLQGVAAQFALADLIQPALDVVGSEMSSRSAKLSARPERRRAAGAIPPLGNNTQRMQLWGLPQPRPISCNDSPAFHRLQTSALCAADSLDCFPSLINTIPQ
jgi:hypothetical protein